MCLFESATCWRIGRKRCSPATRSTVLWRAWIPTSGCSGPPWWPGGRSEERVTASAEAVRSFLTGRPSRSLPRVASRIRPGSVSSTNCTSGSMSSENRTGLCMTCLLPFDGERVAPAGSYRATGPCAAILSATSFLLEDGQEPAGGPTQIRAAPMNEHDRNRESHLGDLQHVQGAGPQLV